MTDETYDPISAIDKQRSMAEYQIERLTREIEPAQRKLDDLLTERAAQQIIIASIDKFYEEHDQIAEDAEKWRKQNASDGKR